MKTAREVMNELKWHPDRDFDLVAVHYIHRGAPGDEMVLDGYQIRDLGQLFFHTAESTIPYHRIFKITYEGNVVFSRRPASMHENGGDTE